MSLTANGLSTGFRVKNKEVVLHADIHFSIYEGDLILLAGRNGIGKSVFLKTIAGIFPPLKGELLLNNKTLKQQKNGLAFMMATPPQVELMSPLEIVLTASSGGNFFNSFSNNEIEAALKALDFCEVLHLKDRTFQELSDGEKQKIMLSRCLIQKSPVILLDEPTAFLDYPSKLDFWQKIKSWNTLHPTSFIICTHDLPIALPEVNQVWLMNQGKFTVFKDPKDFHVSLLND